MKNKNLLILLALVFGLGLYAYFGEYKRELNEVEEKKQLNQIVTFKKDQIQKIEILTSGQSIKLNRTPDGWNLLEPVQDQADNEIVESLLDQVMLEQAVDQISITPAVDLAVYGLSPSLGSIAFEDNSGNKQSVEVSLKKNFEGLYFLRKDKQDTILTSGDTWFSFLSKPAEGFRNLRLFRPLISKVNEINISNQQGQIHLKNKDGQWQAEKFNQLILDQNSVREILTQVSSSKGIQPLQTKPSGKRLMSLQLLGDALNYKSEFYLDKNSKDLLVSLNVPEMNIRFGPQVMEKLRSIKLSDLRDKTLPFQFDKKSVTEVQLKTKLKSQNFVKVNGKWSDKDQVVSDFINKMNALKVYQYLNQPVTQLNWTYNVSMKDAQGKVLMDFYWSEFKDHEAFAKTSKSDEIFQMDDAQIIQLEIQKLIDLKESSVK